MVTWLSDGSRTVTYDTALPCVTLTTISPTLQAAAVNAPASTIVVVLVPASADATIISAKLKVVPDQLSNLILYSVLADVSTSLITPPADIPGSSAVIEAPITAVIVGVPELVAACTVALYFALLIDSPAAVSLNTPTLSPSLVLLTVRVTLVGATTTVPSSVTNWKLLASDVRYSVS